jgi:hypothetical protein
VASLVLGAAGGFLFGPLGFLVGSAIGNLLFPQKQEGPRLSDLHTQTSAYGEMIPILYGKMRISGKVIWADELVEHKHKSGGKGGPSVTTYTYTCSFASYLCEGPIVNVLRIWADKQLIWDINQADSPTLPMTLYFGDTVQTADPTMEAILGVGNVPGYRGTAYVVFEDLELGDYGNRIPDLEFEVLQSAGDIPWRVSTFTPDADSGGLRGVTYDADTGIITVDRYYNSSGGQYRQRHYLVDGTATGVDVDAASGLGNIFQSCNSKHVFSTVAGHFDQNIIAYENVSVQTNVTNPFGGDQDNTVAGPMMVLGDVLYAVGFGGTSAPVGVAAYPLSSDGIIPAGIAASVYIVGSDPTYSPSNLKMIPSDDGFVWFYYLGIGGSGFTTIYKCEPTTLALVHQWDPADLPSTTFLHSGYSYGIYRGLLVFNDGTDCQVYRINGDHTFSAVGDIPETLGPCIPLGAGLFLGSDGVISVIPPEEAITLGQIVADLSDRAGLASSEYDVTDLEDIVPGYTLATQASARDDMSPLQNAWPFDATESSGVVTFVRRGHASVVTIPDTDLAAYEANGSPPAVLAIKRALETDLPRTVSVRYRSLDADYQDGQQYDRRLQTNSINEITLDLPIAMTDTFARSVASVYLFGAWFSRTTFSFWTSYKYAYLEPTDVIGIGVYTMRITKKTEGANGVIAWEAIADDPSLWVRSSAGSGGVGMGDTTIASKDPSTVLLLNLPLISDTDEASGYYAAMYSSTGAAKWSARLYKSIDGGTTYTDVDGSLTADVVGTTTALGNFYGGNTFDEVNILTVTIGDGGGELSSVSAASVLAGQNLALVGNEIIGYRDATLTAPGVYDLTGLLRGRRGTEWAMAGHVADDVFVALPTSVNLPGPTSELGVSVKYKAVTKGTSVAAATAQDFVNVGRALRPYAPVELSGGSVGSGDIMVKWVRRGRTNAAWLDNVDVPLGEASESYIVSFWDSTYTICAAYYTVTAAQYYTITAATITTLYGAAQQTIYFSVGQMGSYGVGSLAYGTAPGGGGSDNAPLVPISPYVWVPTTPPPGPSGPVDYTFPSVGTSTSVDVTFTSGAQWVGAFTTPSSGTGTVRITVSEFAATPAFRHGFLSANSGGVGSIGSTDQYGQIVDVRGTYGAGGFLAYSTTYYFVLNFLGSDGHYLESPGTTHPSLLEFHS